MKSIEKFRTLGGGAKDSAPAHNERKPKAARHFLQTRLVPQFFAGKNSSEYRSMRFSKTKPNTNLKMFE